MLVDRLSSHIMAMSSLGYHRSKLGIDPTLDAAIAYTVQVHQSFRDIDGADQSMIKSGPTAVTCLRKAIMTSPSHMSDTVLMAMIVHTAGDV